MGSKDDATHFQKSKAPGLRQAPPTESPTTSSEGNDQSSSQTANDAPRVVKKSSDGDSR